MAVNSAASTKVESDATNTNSSAIANNTKTKQGSIAASQTQERAMQREAKEALELSKAYTQLKQKVKEQEEEYVRLRQSAGKESPLTQESLANLTTSRGELNQIEKELEKSGNSAIGFGRALKGVYNEVR